MARVIGELMQGITVPFGVNVLWDPIASIDLAAATGAVFIREIMSGVYASDFGLWNTNVGEIVRHQTSVGQKDLKLMSREPALITCRACFDNNVVRNHP